MIKEDFHWYAVEGMIDVPRCRPANVTIFLVGVHFFLGKKKLHKIYSEVDIDFNKFSLKKLDPSQDDPLI